MHPSSILSYYPTYAILDEIISYSNYKTLNIFVDLKNNLQTVYMEHAVLNIVENSLKSKYVDTSIFSSVMAFLAFHKVFAASRGIDINFYIFFETGISSYHRNINKKYKISRRIDELYGLDRAKREVFFHVFQQNLMLVEKAYNLMPKVKVIRLPNLEADFLPFYLIRRSLVDVGEGVANVVYSNDKDLLQTVGKNTFMYFKASSSYKRIIKENEVMEHFLKEKCQFPDSYFPLALAVVGDVGDDIDGIQGIGTKRLCGILDELVSLVGGIEQLYDNVFNRKPIFSSNVDNIQNKYVRTVIEKEEKEKIISNNLKLISFDLLSRALDNPSTTEMIDKRKYIEKVIKEKKTASLHAVKNALDLHRVYINPDDLEVIYYEKSSEVEV